MDAIEAILTRRSIRKYAPGPVPPQAVQTLLEAAMAAPSSKNQQPWAFVLIDDRRILDAIPDFHPHAKMLTSAPLAILVCADTTRQPLEGYWLQDCAAATQNLLLAAHALGLGACWVGVQPREEREAGLRRLLALPDPIRPVAMVALGLPGESKGRAERHDPSRVHRNGW